MYNNYKFLNNFSVDAVRRFFLSKSEELMLKEKGVYAKKVDKQRRRNRITKVSFIIYCYLVQAKYIAVIWSLCKLINLCGLDVYSTPAC